ncbi:hypothetical protein Ahy_B09g095715 isoform B [Arachis hypogaea]|uniref:Large ribosomal subunit protein bL9c n=1 Tax=Arachis hypogaea TaxID=3818 RepID=A0A444XFX4_ARAHY|nr:hypothetical protein Ahy_B09g095715 isoform B [Arachis hypogaea]
MGCYLRYGRHGVKQVLRFRDASYDSTAVNPIWYASQGLRYMRKLQVILTSDVDKLGKAGDTVKVAPGYFRNHLMPKLLAVPNIDKFAHLISEQRKVYFRVARQLCVNIAPENLHLQVPLATLGEYEVPLRLPRSIPLPEGKLNWTLKVKIRSK